MPKSNKKLVSKKGDEICGRACEIYSRVTGYHRPINNWNSGKQEEFKDRVYFKTPGQNSSIVSHNKGGLLIKKASKDERNAIANIVRKFKTA